MQNEGAVLDGLDWFRIISIIVSGGAWVGALIAWRNAVRTQKGLSEARRRDHFSEAYRQFFELVSIPDRATGHDEGRRRAATLCALLGGDTTAKYIATTAYALFCLREEPNADRRQLLQAARDAVEGHLRNPDAPWQPPASDIIREWAGNASGPIKVQPWLVQPHR